MEKLCSLSARTWFICKTYLLPMISNSLFEFLKTLCSSVQKITKNQYWVGDGLKLSTNFACECSLDCGCFCLHSGSGSGEQPGSSVPPETVFPSSSCMTRPSPVFTFTFYFGLRLCHQPEHKKGEKSQFITSKDTLFFLIFLW